MLIGKKWKIESDNLNVTLYEKHWNKKREKDYWTPHSYYSTVHNALEGVIQQEIKGTGLKDFETVVQKVEELKLLLAPLL